MDRPANPPPDCRDPAFRAGLLELLVAAQRRLIEDSRAVRLSSLLEGVLELTGAEYSVILPLEPESGARAGSFTVCRLGWGDSGLQQYHHDDDPDATRSELSSLTAFTANTGERMISNNLRPMAEHRTIPVLRSFMTLPLGYGDAPVGLLGLGNRTGGFDTELADALEPLTLTLGSVLAARHAHDQLESTHRALTRERSLLDAIITNMGDALLIMDCQGHIQRANDTASELFGYREEELIGMHGSELMAEGDRQRLRKLLGRARSRKAPTEVSGLRRDGKEVPLEISLRQMELGRECYLIVTAHDITRRLARTAELRRANHKLERLARRDPLTGVANRRVFQTRLEEEFDRARRHGHPLALVMVDVDHFKLYNDLLGHQSGDDCLKQIARLMRRHFRRAGEVAARIGGEEFALVLPDCTESHARERVQAMIAALRSRRLEHPGQQEDVSISAGLAMRRDSDQDPRALVARADRALYRAKETGRGRLVSSAEASSRTTTGD